MTRELLIKHLTTGEIVKRIDVTGRSDSQVERTMMGVLQNLHDDYVVYDSDDDAEAPA